MIQLLSRYGLLAVLAGLSVGGAARAGSCGAGGFAGDGFGFPAYDGDGGYFNRAWVYPHGGYTLYPGEVGSCVPSHSDYSKIYWTVPAAVNAQGVLDKLQALGVPLVPPEPMFLGKNPRAADDVKLPIPRGWMNKDQDKPREVVPEKGKDAEKLKTLPDKIDPKPKNSDDDL